MGETELIGMVRDVNAQYAVLFGQIITINFAMIVAIYYFLHRSSLLFRRGVRLLRDRHARTGGTDA